MSANNFCLCVCVKERESSSTTSATSSGGITTSRSMDWLNRMRRVWVAFFSRTKHTKSLSSGEGDIGGGSGPFGLMKLQDEVKTCGYQDVQIMWNLMFNKTSDDVDDDIHHDHDRLPCSIPRSIEDAI